MNNLVYHVKNTKKEILCLKIVGISCIFVLLKVTLHHFGHTDIVLNLLKKVNSSTITCTPIKMLVNKNRKMMMTTIMIMMVVIVVRVLKLF